MSRSSGTCERCGNRAEDLENVQISAGRDYGGVGGGPRPPEYASVCGECRAELQEKAEAEAQAEQEALEALEGLEEAEPLEVRTAPGESDSAMEKHQIRAIREERATFRMRPEVPPGEAPPRRSSGPFEVGYATGRHIGDWEKIQCTCGAEFDGFGEAWDHLKGEGEVSDR